MPPKKTPVATKAATQRGKATIKKPVVKTAARSTPLRMETPAYDVEGQDAEVFQEFGFWEIFDYRNYYSRQRYWGVKIGVFAANVFLSFVIGVFAVSNPLLLLLPLLFGLAFAWVSLMTTIKRLRDADLSLFWALMNIIPFVNLITLVVYGCIPSSETKNDGRAGGVIAIMVALMCMFALPVFAMAAYLVYSQQHSVEEAAPMPAPAPEPFHPVQY